MMRINHIKALIEIDLLQSNRQMSNSNRSNKLQKKNIYWRTLLQNFIILFVFVILFGSMIFNVPLANFPGIFSQAISFMVVFSVLQLFHLIFILIYDDTGLSSYLAMSFFIVVFSVFLLFLFLFTFIYDDTYLCTYLAMPFTVGELFLSKIATIALTSFAYFISPMIFIVILGQQTGASLLLSIPIGLLSTLLIMVTVVLGVFIVLDLVNRWSFFRKHKKVFTILIYLLLFGFIFYNAYGNSMGEPISGVEIVDEKANLLFLGFHEIFITGKQLDGWIKIGLWFLTSILFLFIMYKWVIPHLYSENEGTIQKRKTKKSKPISTNLSASKWKVFIKYQLRQLQDTTFILQILFSKFYFPFIMIGPAL